jgi:hypothetical protein
MSGVWCGASLFLSAPPSSLLYSAYDPFIPPSLILSYLLSLVLVFVAPFCLSVCPLPYLTSYLQSVTAVRTPFTVLTVSYLSVHTGHVLSEHVNEVPQSQSNGQQRSRSNSPARGATGVSDNTLPPVPTHTAHKHQDPPSNPGSGPQSRSVSPPPPGVSEAVSKSYQHGNGSGSVNGGKVKESANTIVDHNTLKLPSHSTADAVKPPAIPVNSTVNSTANAVQAPRSATPPPPPASVAVTSSLVSNDEKQPAAEISKGGCCVIG